MSSFDREAGAVRWFAYGMFTICSVALIWTFAEDGQAWIGFAIAGALWGVVALRMHLAAQERALNTETIQARAKNHGAGSAFKVADQDDREQQR